MIKSKALKILGSGPSGLSAAIILAKAGYPVEVYEKNNDAGKKYFGDLQGLENWTSRDDVLDDFKKAGIDINFDYSPVKEITFTDGQKKQKRDFGKPVVYLVKRGCFEGSLDYGLKKQAQKQGVKLHFNSFIPENDADIVATGSLSKNIVAVAKGIIFKTKLPDMAVVILDNEAAYKGYSYLLVTNGYGCMCSMVVKDFSRLNDCFEKTKKIFLDMLGFELIDPMPVGGAGCFTLKNQFRKNNTLFVGEAAGLQDFFAGFGIRSAVISGCLAARSIIEHEDYGTLARACFDRKQKAGLVIRFLWEKVNRRDYSFILNKVKTKQDIFDFLYSYHNFNFIEKLIYPVAFACMKFEKRI
ncbi:MAG TPA: NAD(P)/FAD-dependent oxidoreductase [Smithella sp.]|nr:NAD(P)/FAD-dependent oxidoreductase [Smithella sp.]